MNIFSKNYRKGYDMILEEYKKERRKKGLSNAGYPNKIVWIYLSFLAIGASMALTVSEVENSGEQDELHIPKAVWITMGWLIFMSILFLTEVLK